ncbi:MAG: hypothetical protein VW362_08065 [Candidatus Nanopelagicales bacterium]
MTELAYEVMGDFPTSIHEHPTGGHLCGYIGVTPGHPWYGKDYEEIGADVHGGLTFAQHERRDQRFNWDTERWLEIDSEPYPHDTGMDVWWVGFDCAHLGDLSPRWPEVGGVYRDEAYVRNELASLVRQAAAALSAVEAES